MTAINAPYSIMNKQIDYFTHSQINSYLSTHGNAIIKASNKDTENLLKNDRRIAGDITRSNIDAANMVSSQFQQGFGELNSSIINQTNIISQGLEDVNLGINNLGYAVNSGFNNLTVQLYETGNQISNTIVESAKQTTNALTNAMIETTQIICGSLAEMKSSFDMGMMNIVNQFELQRNEMKEGFDKLANILENSRKTEAQERFRDGKNEFEAYLKYQEETVLLQDALNYLKQSIEIYNGNPFSHYYLGMIYLQPRENFYNPEKAKEHFLNAVAYSKRIENNAFTSLSYFNASWVSYILQDVNEAIKLGELSKQFDANKIPENWYNLGKYYAYQNNSNKALEHLDVAVKRFDPAYTVKANIDLDYLHIKNDLFGYFLNIKNQEATILKNKMQNFGINL